MEINWKDNMNEIGGAFLLSWAVFGMGNVEFAIVLAVAWMAFAGAHLLPVVTWCHMLTGDLSDTEGNWMANGMRLLAQAIGACLAIVLATEAGGIETGWSATDMWITEFNGDTLWTVLGLIAAGAIWWQIHTRSDSVWVSSFAMMVLATATVGGLYPAMIIDGALQMGSSITNMGDGMVNTLLNWFSHGALVGAGALLGVKIDEMIDNMSDSSEEE